MNARADQDELDLISTHIVPSCISLIFCFLPGIFAVIWALLAINDKRNGDAVAARKHAETAKQMMIVAYALGLGVLVLELFAYFKA